ncbi:MAG: saccharopine dehydrogenase NADP-binding domain-containing protein [Rickettsiales bacterium]|nr:saccharopine dehydrogenase NADP-binding domain-containing protein [Rickettsiales bacterium]
MKKVLIIGGYGNFGSRIAAGLVKANIAIIIAGRDQSKAKNLQQRLQLLYPQQSIEAAVLDVNDRLAEQLRILKPRVVVNVAGPFQNCDYTVALACIKENIHYIDLADGRDFVNEIVSLHSQAIKSDVLVVSGASTVPGLSSAVLEHYKSQFLKIDSLIYGISPGQQTSLGLATVKSILCYVGKPLKRCYNDEKIRYGWQDLYRQEYPILGKRWMANCDIPDFDIFSNRYGIEFLRFSAGVESHIVHLGIWFLSYLVRIGLLINLPKYANFLFNCSKLFQIFGTQNGGMHMLLQGKDLAGKPKELRWFIIAEKGDGPQIPCTPAIILAKKLINETVVEKGAMPCVGLITLEEYLEQLKDFSIKEIVT